MIVGSGGPPAGWQTYSFDDSSWSPGTGAFGQGTACPVSSTDSTTWPVGTQILLRHPITLPAGTTSVTVSFGVDNGATVYWNGAQIGSVNSGGCAYQNQYSYAVPSGGFVTGSGNLLAVLGSDDGISDSFLDLSVIATVSGGPSTAESFGTGSGAFGPNWVARHAEPVNTATGNYDTQVTDLSMPGRGIPFALTRTYNSLDPTVGPFGQGWSFSYGAHLTFDASGNATVFADDGAQYVFAANGSGGFVTPPGSTANLAPETGGYLLTRQDQLAYHFSTAGALTSETDRHGNAIALAYNSSGQLSAITDTVGRVVTLTYDAAGHVTGLADPIGRPVSYAYNAAGQLASVTDVRGGRTAYTYDSAGRLATITDQNGHTLVTNTYDPTTGRLTQQQDSLGDVTTFAWNASSTTSTMTDARGGTWTDVYTNGLLTSNADPLGDTTSYTYDAGFNTTAVTDPDGHTTTMTYDASGNL